MYAGFAFACIWGYRKQFISNGLTYKKKALLITLVISIAYGGLTELMQEFFIPLRTGDRLDFLADSAGALIGAMVFYLFFRHKK